MRRGDMKVACTYCLHASVPAIKKCLTCDASMCQNHLTAHSKSADHTLTDVQASPTIRRCQYHHAEFSLYCMFCKTCLCVSCKELRHGDHHVVSLIQAYWIKKELLKGILITLTTQREKIPRDIQQLELARDGLTQKITDTIFLINSDDVLSVVQERETERSDFCDLDVDSERRIKKMQEEHRQERFRMQEELRGKDEKMFLLGLGCFVLFLLLLWALGSILASRWRQ